MDIVAFLIAQGGATTTSTAPAIHPVLVLIAGVVGWAALWAQLVIIPFYNKRELLSKDYHLSGRINSAIAAIESDGLIKSLASMFKRAMEANPDKRTKPPIEELLDSATVLPDLRAAQQAMSDIETLNRCYEKLCVKSGRLWKWGLAHALTALSLVGEYSLLASHPWIAWILGITAFTCVATFVVMLYGMYSFHNLICLFNGKLESNGSAAG